MLDLIDNVVGQEHVAFQACTAVTDMESIAQEWASRVASKTDQLQVLASLAALFTLSSSFRRLCISEACPADLIRSTDGMDSFT